MLHTPHAPMDGHQRRSPVVSAGRGGRMPTGRDRTQPRRGLGKSWSHRRLSDTSGSASSAFHGHPLDEGFSDSDVSSGEDPIAYRNARQFPPQLPAAASHRPSHPRSKSSAANIITSWVSQYEKARSPLRKPRSESEPSVRQTDEDADEEEKGSVASGVSSQGEIESLWQQLKEKRARLNEIKTQMARRRKELRDLRRKKDDADNAFMSVIRPILVNQRGLLHTSQSLLDRRLGDMQRVRTEYHFLESNYEGLEVMLDEEEEELNGLETRFFSILATGRAKATRHVSPPEDSDPAFNYPSDVPFVFERNLPRWAERRPAPAVCAADGDNWRPGKRQRGPRRPVLRQGAVRVRPGAEQDYGKGDVGRDAGVL